MAPGKGAKLTGITVTVDVLPRLLDELVINQQVLKNAQTLRCEIRTTAGGATFVYSHVWLTWWWWWGGGCIWISEPCLHFVQFKDDIRQDDGPIS